jgi:uncharacterized Ntn-hydrolase superfamily protein
MVDPGYGPRCLELLAAGASAQDALDQVRAADDGREVRQVGLIDSRGQVASFTGSMCIDHVGLARGEGYSTQANMMAGPGVCQAMAEAFEHTSGTLATRLVAALVAAETKGGDARGQMSAAIIVVEGERHDHPWQGVLTDVRVDHSPDPLGELARLVQVAEAYHQCDAAEEALVRGDVAAALAGAEAGLALLPGEENLLLSYVGALIGVGRVGEAAATVQKLVAEKPPWEGIMRAIFDRGMVPLPDDLTFDALLGRSVP